MNYREALAVLNGRGSMALEHGTELRYEEGDIVLSYRDIDIMAWHMDGSISLSRRSEHPSYNYSTGRLILARINKYLPLGWHLHQGTPNWWLIYRQVPLDPDQRSWLFYDGIAILDDDVVSLPF